MLVLSSEATPYRHAAIAYSAQLERHGHQVTTVQFSALTPQLLDDLVKVADVFTAVGSEAAVALRANLPPEVPLTFCMVSDSAAAGLSSDLPAFGVTTDVPLKEQFALIAEALPHVRTVGMLYNADSPRSANLVRQVRRELPLGWDLAAVSISSHRSVAEAVNELFRQEVDVVWTAADSTVYDTSTVRALLLASVRRKVPVFGFSSAFVRAGALLGVSIDPVEQGRQCAEITQQLLEHMAAEPANLSHMPDSTPPNFQFDVNLVAAEAMGVTLPAPFLRKANRVIAPE